MPEHVPPLLSNYVFLAADSFIITNRQIKPHTFFLLFLAAFADPASKRVGGVSCVVEEFSISCSFAENRAFLDNLRHTSIIFNKLYLAVD
jgi:hypothetical protein